MPRRKGEQSRAGTDVPAEPLIDRVLELDILRQHLGRVAESGSGYAVLVVGESGVGKSRLVAEARNEAHRLGMPTLSVQCLGRGAEPLLPFKEGLAAYLGRSPEQIRRTLARAAPLLLDAVPFIGAFLGKVGERLADAGFSMKGTYEELTRILARIADSAGLFLVVEDLHAADPDSLYFVNYLLRKATDHRVLVAITIQEEQLDDFPQLADLVAQWTVQGCAQLTVVPLERAYVGEYVRQMAAMGKPADEAMIDRLFWLTGGNPFFLREAFNLITQPPGPHGVAETIPPRAGAVLRRRLARADELTSSFLKAASVVLETAQQLEPVTYVMETTPKDAISALDKACELRVMVEGRHGEIRFVHALMQREVYTAMGANQRRYLHSRAGQWFERNGNLASASYHFEQAEQIEDLVRTARQAASRAEQAGMYHTALMLYQKIRPYVSIEDLGPLLGRALIVLGDWDEAEELAERLPVDDSRVRLLRSELRFVRGDFEGAKEEAEMALVVSSADRIDVLIRLSDISLYFGDFSGAQRYGHEALQMADEAGLRARCLGVIAATEFFGGNVEAAHARFSDALRLLEHIPEVDRDRTIYTTVLGNLGVVAEEQNDWAAAERYHRQALRLRREVADARGVLHTLHAIGRTRIGLDDREDGQRYIAEAERLAADLDETLERAKIWHSQAELLLKDGECETAHRRAADALENFSNSRTLYDVTHVELTLSATALACGRPRPAADYGASARSSVAAMGYGLLRRKYPDIAYDLSDRIAGALTAYVCGDALGLPWEGVPRDWLSADEIEQIPAREGWPRGATSDDTALTLLVARHLAERDGEGDARAFLGELAEHAPHIRGLGPSTSKAIEHFRRTGEVAPSGGATNGAAMRALPTGWILPHHQHERRRQLAIEMSRATHAEPSAHVAASAMASCASWAIEDASRDLLLEVAIEEAEKTSELAGTDRRLAELLTEVSERRWTPPAEGISLHPYETVAAVMSCVLTANTLHGALIGAVQLRGDTDTVTALVGGLHGARHTPAEVRTELPWHPTVLRPELESEIADLSTALATVRVVLSK